MAKDDKKKVAPEAREIPIEGDSANQDSEAAASAPDAKADSAPEVPAEDAQSCECENQPKEEKGDDSNPNDDITSEAEEVVAEAERIAKAEQEAAALRDKYLRLQAEWDNYRKRSAEEAADMRVRAAEKLMSDILPVLDDFERAIAYAEENGETGLLEGVKAIDTKLNEVFAKHGLEALNPLDQAFDALEHQAVSTIEDTSVPDETVTQVFQKGYRLGKKILRPAMVTISTGGPKRETDDAAEDGKEQ